MCSDRKPLKTVVFRHSSAALGVLAKEMKGLYMGSQGCTTVSSLVPTRPIFGVLLTAAVLQSVCQLLLIHLCITHLSCIFWAFKFSKSLPGFMIEKTEVFVTWLEPNRCLSPLWYSTCFFEGFKTVYLRCLILPFPHGFSLNSFIWVNAMCLKR